MEQARIEHAPNGSLLTYITSADALVNKSIFLASKHKNEKVVRNKKLMFQIRFIGLPLLFFYLN